MGGDMSIVLDGSVGISSIGTLTGVTSISSTTADTPVILQDSSSNSNTCRAWVNFKGTSTVTIRTDFNVTSITDHGTGQYTVNFSVAFADADYCFVGGTGQRNVDLSGDLTVTAPTSSAFRCTTFTSDAAAYYDTDYVYLAFFR